jgi:formate dehydrogenase major subunit
MTNHWIDIRNADVILVCGANPAENHPISYKWIQEAIDKRGAKLVVIDPRFTRTASHAHNYVPVRSGANIAFFGGLINYILQNNLMQKDYVANYTNASFLVNPALKMPGELDGLFSGYDPATRKYDKATWAYQKDPKTEIIIKDKTLTDPNSVFQLMKKHYSRYSIETASSITGASVEQLKAAYEVIASTGKADRAGTLLYAMGLTQSTTGVQNIRAGSIVQLLLGNIGIAGGGVNAMRGESNVQGSTDQGLLFHILPGYVPMPTSELQTLEAYKEKNVPKTKEPQSVNWWGNRGKYMVSYLKAIYGPNALKSNDFRYDLLPKPDLGGNYSWLMIFDRMYDKKIKGFFAWGQNPACCTSNATKTRKALSNLDWMVAVNIFDNETASFWKGPGMDPAKVNTEVFLLPAAASYEKEGSIANSGRWAQWRYKAVEPLGESRADLEIIDELYHILKEKYLKEGGALPEQLTLLDWNYKGTNAEGKAIPIDVKLVAKELNGSYWSKDGKTKAPFTDEKTLDKDGKPTTFKQVPGFAKLQDDGMTSSGNWLYCASFTDAGNMMARRGKDDPTGLGLYPKWAWCWPVNRRILYNRASVDLDGKPLDPSRKLLAWNATDSKWVGDVVDSPATIKPMSDLKEGGLPFIMKSEGVASLYGPGLNDGPFPEHYEALECPLSANPMGKQRINPTAKLWFKEGGNSKAEDVFASCDARFPLLCSTYRVTEHWQTGVMTRNSPWLLEMQPQQFVEMSPQLAKERNIANGDKVKVVSVRGQVDAVAIVTTRLMPFRIGDSTVHQVGLPWCFGWTTPNAGDTSNLLTPTVGDANTMIPETKAFMVDVRKG